MSPTLLTYRLRVGFIDLFFGILACSPGDRWTGPVGSGTCPNRRPPAEAWSHRMDSEWGVMNYLEKSPASHEHPDSAYHMPGTELRSPAHRHRSAGAHLTHLMDHESPPGPRRPPESSPHSPGGSSSAANHRASRLSAGAALSRAGFCGLPRSGRGPPGIRSAPEPAASGRGPDHLGLQHRSVQRNQPPGRRSRRRVFFI